MKLRIISTLITAALILANFSVSADETADTASYVSDSINTLTNFANDPEMSWFRDHIKDAKGILIIPRLYKAGFLFGFSAGTGVLLKYNNTADQENTSAKGRWSNPAFYTLVSLTAGAQIGMEVAETVLVIMTQKGIEAMLSPKLQLGADVSVALGPVGAGLQAATADVLQYTRAKGVFAGLTLEGAIISPRDALNETYYSKPASPLDILIKQNVVNAQADPLRAKLEQFKTNVNATN